MRRPSHRSARCRAVIAVAALYGLLLQAFLVALQPLPVFAADGVICAAHHDGGPSDDGLPCGQQPCCTAVHAAQPLAGLAPPQTVSLVPWRRAVAAIWRPTDTRGARAPPDPAVSPRGPPAA